MSARRICVVTGSRAEYGILYPLLCLMAADPGVQLQLLVTGTHLSARHGETICEIEDDGFEIATKVDLGLDGDAPTDVLRAMGQALTGMGGALERLKPDLVVVLGDRFEILCAAEAAMISRVPIAHIHGGEASEGQIDEAIRHAITKMAQYHFVAADPYRRRVIQMGEQPARVFTVGAPGLDPLLEGEEADFADVAAEIGLGTGRPLFLVTYHPVTLRSGDERAVVRALLEALDGFDNAQTLFTGANADVAGGQVEELVGAYVGSHPDNSVSVTSLGWRRYTSALRAADVVIGNSSSGIIEAPAVGTPTVNIGPRQDGRLRAPSIIDCGETTAEIGAAISLALSRVHGDIAARCETPYGRGGASQKILEKLKSLPLDDILMKRFYDLEVTV